MNTRISYGKIGTSFQRTYAAPLALPGIPESEFVGRSNTVFACTVGFEVFGDNFLPAYTHGDNSQVVATDSMKNFILREAAFYPGSTLEGLLHFLGVKFLETYPHIEALEVSGKEVPFQAVRVPAAQGEAGFVDSPLLFDHAGSDVSTALLRLERRVGGPFALTAHACGRVGFRLLKVSGSSFAAFVRDDYTTLPEYTDRPLFVYMDLGWRYSDPADALRQGAGYVPGEQLSDLARTVFHEFNSKSIQELIYVMGTRMLERFPQLQSVSFDSENHTWDRVTVHPEDSRIKVFWEPKAAYGNLRLTLERGSQ